VRFPRSITSLVLIISLAGGIATADAFAPGADEGERWSAVPAVAVEALTPGRHGQVASGASARARIAAHPADSLVGVGPSGLALPGLARTGTLGAIRDRHVSSLLPRSPNLVRGPPALL